jgi:predicted amidohydrolase
VIVGLASPRVASSIDDGLNRIKRLMADAAARGAEIVCFPEAYLPGLRGQDFDVPAFERDDEFRAVFEIGAAARECRVAVVLGMEHISDDGRQIAAFVFAADGQLLGMQTKNQLDPSEDRFYVPGTSRRVFEVNGVPFGIAICHEGWRYPETVRWAATRGAKIVFHPQLTGSHQPNGTALATFGSENAPYYEKAMRCRSIENTIYFASVNYAVPHPEAATALIAPSGECQAYLPYGEEGVLVAEVDLAAATGLIASRYAPARYQDVGTQ